MSVAERSYMGDFPIAGEAGIEARAEFISKTYLHLAGSILAFIGLEVLLFQLPNVEQLSLRMFSGYNFFIVLVVYMVVSGVAGRWARSATSLGTQYLGLGVFILAEAIIFLPLLYIAHRFAPNANVISTAATMTLITFAGLTAVVFVTRKNFSFLGPAIGLGFTIAIGFIVCSMLFGFQLGTLFTVAVIALAAGAILYQTSNILHTYRVGQHVAAALGLFAAIATLFWYMIIFFMNRD